GRQIPVVAVRRGAGPAYAPWVHEVPERPAAPPPPLARLWRDQMGWTAPCPPRVEAMRTRSARHPPARWGPPTQRPFQRCGFGSYALGASGQAHGGTTPARPGAASGKIREPPPWRAQRRARGTTARGEWVASGRCGLARLG